jgi:hypothetical protein
MDFFFASDALLGNVEYYDKIPQPDGTRLEVRKPAGVLIKERNEVIEELKAPVWKGDASPRFHARQVRGKSGCLVPSGALNERAPPCSLKALPKSAP